MEDLILERGRAGRNYWRDIWSFRELLYFLAHRDILVRYKQTIIGVAWAVIRPALTMLIFVMFRRITKQTSGAPDSILVFAALLPWQFFSSAVTEASGSLVGNASLISKVYFPRLLVPMGTIATALVDFAVTLALLAVLMLWYRFTPGWQLIMLFPLIALTLGLSLGMGLLLAALNVQYRDFRYVVPFIVQFGLFVSPIAFDSASVPAHWRFMYSLNPMVGIIDGFRWAILRGSNGVDVTSLALSVLVTIVFCTVGIWYFRRTERSFADII